MRRSIDFQQTNTKGNEQPNPPSTNGPFWGYKVIFRRIKYTLPLATDQYFAYAYPASRSSSAV
jgi:uncharacterized membrane protein